MQYPKRLIEVDLPIKAISAHARREKSIRHGHISTLHIWWARRPLAACRAVLCAALWPDPADERCPQAFRDAAARLLCDFAEKVRADATLAGLCKAHWSRWNRTNSAGLRAVDFRCWPELRYALLDFIADFANWDASAVPAFLEAARALTLAAHEALGGIPGTRPLVADPFAGGGAIPVEALRIGADAFASDLNPVAVLLTKVVLEYIPRYGQRLADEVGKWGMWIKEQAEQELGEFYPKGADGTTPIAYLWARTITCEGPGCGAEIPLMRTLWLAKKGNDSVALRISPNLEEKKVDFEIIQNAKVRDIGEGTIRHGAATCPICGYTTPVTSIRKQLQARHGGAGDARLLAVRYDNLYNGERSWRLACRSDFEGIHKAERELKDRLKRQDYLSLIPSEPLPRQGTLGFRVQLYGMKQWSDLFTARQILTLTTLSRLIQSLIEQRIVENDLNLTLTVHTCLALALSRFADFSSSLCTLNVVGGRGVAHTFVRQALPIVWDFMETNPFNEAGANWQTCIDVINETIQAESQHDHEGVSERANATRNILPDSTAKALVTDPPYYDAVPYADLSDFFYVWLRRTLPMAIAALYTEPLTPKDEECIVDETKGKDNTYFENTMRLAMAEGCRILAPDGISIVVFANKSTSGWEAQLQAMIDAGWTITGSWPIDTERPSRLRAQDSAALASSIHLVCRPRKNPDGSLRMHDIGDWREVLHELPERIHEWMPRLAAEGVIGADAIFACLGPALEVFSRYSCVERADGERVPLREYLEYVWAAVSREALNMIFQGADTSGFEADARLTAMWLWTLSASEPAKEGGNGKSNGKLMPNEGYAAEDGEEDEEGSPRQVVGGYALEFDAARKIAQGLGANLDKLTTLVEVKGSTARLRSVTERGRALFEKDAGEVITGRPRKREKAQQLAMFSVEELEESFEGKGSSDLPAFTMGNTTLDRLHQSMLLFATGRGDTLRRFLREDGVGTDQRYWRLAQALSSLYPPGSEERRWVEGVQSLKKNLGL